MNRAGLDMIDADSLEQVKGLCVYPLVTEEYREAFKAMVKEVFKGGSRTLEFNAIGLKGRPVWLYSHAVPLRNEKGEIISMISAAIDVTERKMAEEELNKSLKEKEVLLKEIHHRVKNNMAIVSAMLQLQSRFSGDSNIKTILEDSQNRINSMAMVHEKLYESENLSSISLRSYVKELVHHLLETYSHEKISFEHEIDDIELDIDHIIPLGLILNELLTNSIKHAFSNVNSPEIGIHVSSNEGDANLIYRDNGAGLPEDLSLQNAQSLGLKIIQMLSYQLKGSIDLDETDRAKYTLSFPI
jgi:two-component sensor histidine kinase